MAEVIQRKKEAELEEIAFMIAESFKYLVFFQK